MYDFEGSFQRHAIVCEMDEMLPNSTDTKDRHTDIVYMSERVQNSIVQAKIKELHSIG